MVSTISRFQLIYLVRLEVFPADCVNELFSRFAAGDFFHAANVSTEFFSDFGNMEEVIRCKTVE
jgi:hypothetical protein